MIRFYPTIVCIKIVVLIGQELDDPVLSYNCLHKDSSTDRPGSLMIRFYPNIVCIKIVVLIGQGA